MKTLSILTLFVIIAASCSKEKSIERHLHKKGGKWNITTWTETNYTNNQQESIYVYNNFGSFLFNENASGILTIIEDGESYTQAFTWLNSETDIFVTIDGETLPFKIVEESKKEMTLEWTETFTSLGTTYKSIYTIKLDKE